MVSKKKRRIYCFIDTNLLLHFQTFDEIDWKKILQASQVDLVIAPVVLREINKFKDDRADDWRQKRVRMLIPKLRDFLMSSKQIRNGVSLLGIAKEPTIDWVDLGLDPQISDDRLIAAIIEFINNHIQEDIVLVTDDILLQFKAQFHGIAVREPDGLITRYERPSEETIKIRKLEYQIQQLTSRIPKLTCGFYDKKKNEISDTIDIPMGSSWIWESPEEFIIQEIDKRRANLQLIIAQAQRQVKDSEIENFIAIYENYLKDYEITSKKMWLRNVIPCIKVNLAIDNSGTGPARGSILELTFPVGSSVVDKDFNQIVWTIDAPKEPIPPWKEDVHSQSERIARLSPIRRAYQSIDISSYFPPGEYEYSQQFERLNHKYFTFVKPLTVFLPPETKQGFKIAYSIGSDELIDIVDGILKVNWV